MATLYLTEPYSTVRRDGETLEVHIPANRTTGSPAQKKTVPLHKVERVVVQGDVTLTGAVVHYLLELRIPVAFCSFVGQFAGMLTPPDSKNGLLRQAQHAAATAPQAREIARAMVLGKVHNQKTMLQRTNRKVGDTVVAAAVARMTAAIETLRALALPSDPATAQALLMGQEGIAAQAYFEAFPLLLVDTLGFTRRVRRPPTDPINAMLSYGYSLLSYAAMAALQIVGFDGYTGFLHSSRYGRPALALDLMEEFRAIIVDSVVLRLVNTRAITASDFEQNGTSTLLTATGRRTFLDAFEQRLNSEIHHPVFDYSASYRRCLELQARILARVVTGEIAAYVPFKVR